MSLLSCSWSFVYSTPFCACFHVCIRIFDFFIGMLTRQSVQTSSWATLVWGSLGSDSGVDETASTVRYDAVSIGK